ncbi:MAG TPA: hypothetical protein VFD13_10075 [Candidatus Kapabacteria bacterium]|nr:hypothetical protein [Candidatus Kapabacteria bacterium]
MNRTLPSILLSILFAAAIASCGKRTEQTAATDTTSHVQVVPAPERTYPDAKLTIVAPREGEVLKKASDSVLLLMQLSGTELGVHTGADSTLGIAYAKQGQHIHVIVDDKPYMADFKNGQPFNAGVLAPGAHTIRAFPSFSWHESIKSPNAFATRTFYVGAAPKAGAASANNLNGPLLTYSRPKGTYAASEDSKILLDFYVSNATLAPDKYKVKLWIDGAPMPDIVKWQPYYIQGLANGKHEIKLQLIAPDGSVVPGTYNNPSGEITVE